MTFLIVKTHLVHPGNYSIIGWPFYCHYQPLLSLTCNFVGIQPERVKPASPIELTMSQTGALQARRSCVSSREAFGQSFHTW